MAFPSLFIWFMSLISWGIIASSTLTLRHILSYSVTRRLCFYWYVPRAFLSAFRSRPEWTTNISIIYSPLPRFPLPPPAPAPPLAPRVGAPASASLALAALRRLVPWRSTLSVARLPRLSSDWIFDTPRDFLASGRAPGRGGWACWTWGPLFAAAAWPDFA